MEDLWILGQSAGEGPGGLEVTPVGEGAEHEGMTKSDGSPDANDLGTQGRPRGGLLQSPFLLIMLMLVVFYFLLFRGPRKRQQQQRQMVQSLKKNDRVRTVGGIMGTVVDVKDDEVTLKIDESNNTKIKVLLSAISKNLSQQEK